MSLYSFQTYILSPQYETVCNPHIRMKNNQLRRKFQPGVTLSLLLQLGLQKLVLFFQGCCDFVEVRHGSSSQRICGSALPTPISSSGSMEVTFRSDRSLAYTGFLALACCDLTVTTTGKWLVCYCRYLIISFIMSKLFSTSNYNSIHIYTIPNNNNHHWSDHHHNCHHHHSNMQLRPGQQSHKNCWGSGD